MTDAAAPHPGPATKLRPAGVTAATWLLVAVAAAYLIDAIMIIAGSGEYPDRVREAMEESGVAPGMWSLMSGIVGVMPVVAAGLTIVSAVVVLVLAATVARGSFVGRILTWVAVGFALLCNLCGLGSAGSPSFSSVAYVNANSRDRSGIHVFSQRLPEAYPDWYRHTSLALFTFGMLAMIAVAVLLALPAANAYFRRVPRLMTGPYGAPVGYPGHPGGQFPAAVPPAAPTPEQVAEALSTLERRRERGELTDEQYAAERARLNG